MAGVRDDEQHLVLRYRIGLAHCIISGGLALYHVLISRLTEITGMSFLAVHDEYRRTYLVDIIEEARVGIRLTTKGVPTIVAVARTGMVSTTRLIVIIIVLDKLRRIGRQRIYHAPTLRQLARPRSFGAFGSHRLTRCITSFFAIALIKIAVAIHSAHVVHRARHRSLDAWVNSSCIQRYATPSANTDDAYLLLIYIGQTR